MGSDQYPHQMFCRNYGRLLPKQFNNYCNQYRRDLKTCHYHYWSRGYVLAWAVTTRDLEWSVDDQWAVTEVRTDMCRGHSGRGLCRSSHTRPPGRPSAGPTCPRSGTQQAAPTGTWLSWTCDRQDWDDVWWQEGLGWRLVTGRTGMTSGDRKDWDDV